MALSKRIGGVMEIIRDNSIEEMMEEMNYAYEEDRYSDKQLNTFYNYYIFFRKYEDKIIGVKRIPLEIILYSKYYWFSRLVDRCHELYGSDAGIDQQQFQMLEEIDQRIEDVDWDFVEKLKYGKV